MIQEYKDCYIAFLDILGFRSLIQTYGFEEIKKIYNKILDFQVKPLIKANVYQEINSYIMSDSVVLYIAAELTDSFIALLDTCLQLQIKLLLNNPPIFLRGGIDKGLLYHQGNIIFGEGLIKAYTLESQLAVYPRIIFTKGIRDSARDNMARLGVFDYKPSLYKKDFDELYYVNYLETFNYLPSLPPGSVEEIEKFENRYYEKLLENIDEILSVEISKSIREKYCWVKQKVYENIENIPSVKEYFEDKEKKKKENEMQRLQYFIKNNKE